MLSVRNNECCSVSYRPSQRSTPPTKLMISLPLINEPWAALVSTVTVFWWWAKSVGNLWCNLGHNLHTTLVCLKYAKASSSCVLITPWFLINGSRTCFRKHYRVNSDFMLFSTMIIWEEKEQKKKRIDVLKYQSRIWIERPACNVNQMFSTLNGLIYILPQFCWSRREGRKWRLKSWGMVDVLIKLHVAIGALRKSSVSKPLESSTVNHSSPWWFKLRWFEPQHEPQLYFWAGFTIFKLERKEAIDQTWVL